MNRGIFSSQRSTEAPMDFQFTNRPSSTPAWAADDPSTPKKRSHEDASASQASTPSFGTNNNTPFLFQTPSRQPSQPYPWVPPPNFSPTKAFPQELHDVDMSEASPPKPVDDTPTRGRPIATGALRRVYRARQKAGNSQLSRSYSRDEDGDDDMYDNDSDREDEGRAVTPVAHNTSNHYTLNMPSPPTPQSDTPYILLGYLQFFFNLSLILVFLYLLVQFILTVQRDVAHRVSEYSQDIVQEIALCALQFKNNLCATPLPAMAQQCATWETCMNRDPATMGRARIGAELIAEVVNGFVEPISWKTLIFTLSSMSFLTVFINTLLSLYRARILHSATPPPHAQPPQYPMHPAQFGVYPPTPAWGKQWKSEEELEAPTRRRRLDGGGEVKIK